MALLTEYAELEELGAGKFRQTLSNRPIAYRENGDLHAIDRQWVDSGDGTRPHLVSTAKLMVSVGNDGLRRLHPTRDANKYLEIGAPFVKVDDTHNV